MPVDEAHLLNAPAFAQSAVEGRYDGARQFLVDNHTRRGVPGYLVVTPFETIGGKRLLVDRGWIAAPVSRNDLPDAPTPDTPVRIIGVLWAASSATTDAAHGATAGRNVSNSSMERE